MTPPSVQPILGLAPCPRYASRRGFAPTRTGVAGSLILRGLGIVLTVTALGCAAPDQGALRTGSSDVALGAPAAAAGFSEEGLARIRPAMQEVVDEGGTAGVMTLVAREGRVVHWDAVGWRVLDEDPLEPDDIFRIYSMTKPVTSVAVMMLVEEGLIGLDDPVADYLPAFGDVEVLDDGVLRPPARAVTIRDLLRHTSGLTYGVFADTPVDRLYREALNPLPDAEGPNLEETADIVASLPLLFDPGTAWNYSLSTDVLGRVVEVASGRSLPTFFQERIFTPLRMHDTGFRVAPEDADRLVSVYRGTEEGLVEDSQYEADFLEEPAFYSGGGGLTSSALDYLRFAQMLLQGGELDGVRLLRPETVAEMTSNQLPDGGTIPISPVDGFGLGFAVSVAGDTPGIYWWSGVANTWFWIDPVEEIVAFAWTQYEPYAGVPLNPVMRGLVYDALQESRRGVPAGTP